MQYFQSPIRQKLEFNVLAVGEDGQKEAPNCRAETKIKKMVETFVNHYPPICANRLLYAVATPCIIFLSWLSVRLIVRCRGTFSKTYLSGRTLFCRALTANVRALWCICFQQTIVRCLLNRLSDYSYSKLYI